jgi:ABC-2 type transport system permease protein
MLRPVQFIIRVSSFLGKELTEIFRQPQLILILILGPFLIMLLFGIAYPDQTRPLKTIFVVSDQNPFRPEIEGFTSKLRDVIAFEGIEPNEQLAISKLALKQVDVVIVVPEDPLNSIRQNQQAQFRIYHNEVDPYQIGYIRFVANDLVDEMNRQVLQSLTEQGQEDTASLQTNLESAITDARNMREALERGDVNGAVTQKDQLKTNLDLVRAAVGVSVALSTGVENGSTSDPNAGGQDLLTTMNQVDQSVTAIDSLDANTPPTDAQSMAIKVADVENNLVTLNDKIKEFRSVQPRILVSPFTYKTSPLAQAEYTPTKFFTPSVIALLLQHLSVTFSALSIVRERNSGIMELFRVSPISAFEALLGKYLSYMVFELLLTAVITLLVVYFLGVPMLGNWWQYAAAVSILLFTSLGFGFLISLLASTDTQAVQFSMLFLLASIFFSGFFMDLRLMWKPITFLAWSLPATYGIRMLQDIMLRGYSLPILIFEGLLAIGIGLFVINWSLLKRKMETY